MGSDKNVLKVRIYGAEYPVRSDEDINHIKEVAEYVDKKMREVDNNVRVDSSLKVSILASLNIADELFRAWKDKDMLRTQLQEKINKLNEHIDLQLEDKTD